MERSLREAVGRLEQERELRERFVSTLSHDLRTPLTSAKLSAQLLTQKSVGPATLPKLSERIVKSINRADRMIQDLLDANRIRAGEPLPLTFEEFDLAELARVTLDELDAGIGGRFVLQAKTAVRGQWNADGMRRVIENLASNAVKYGASDQPITVSVTVESSQAWITVANSGNPISKEDQSTLFEQFRRAPTAERGPQKGWGLGLTPVRGIVEAHGGRVTVESNPSIGTRFHVALPMKS